VFRDICKLLSPGTNLRSFGRLFNLEQEKAHFPFSYLTSVNVLAEPNLPADKACWESTLTSARNISQEDIAEAQQLFQAKNCKNIGDYLRIYLLLDVEILFLAVQKWREALKSYVQLDFVEVNKYTMSSLANLAIGRSLVSRNHIGMFFPTIPKCIDYCEKACVADCVKCFAPKLVVSIKETTDVTILITVTMLI